jgi:hypothetical protein
MPIANGETSFPHPSPDPTLERHPVNRDVTQERIQFMPKMPNKRMKARNMVFVARESASIEVGDQDAVILAGRTCVPAESPLLRVAPSLFQPVPKLGARLVPPRYSPRYAEPRDASGAQISEPIPPGRRLRSRSYLVHKGVQIAHVGQLFDRDSAIAQAIAVTYPGTLTPDEEDPGMDGQIGGRESDHAPS